MRDQNQRPGELKQRLFQRLQRGDVQIIGRLIEHQHVGRLQHQPCDQHTRAFATAKPIHRLIQLLAGKQELGRIAGHMGHAALVDHRVRIRRQCPPQRETGVQLAHLTQVDDAQAGGPLDDTRIYRELTRHGTQQRCLAGAVRAAQAKTRPVHQREADVVEDVASTERNRHVFHLDEPLALPVRRVERDTRIRRAQAAVHVGQFGNQAVRIVDAGLGLGSASLGSAAQPFDLRLDPVAQALLHLLLRLHVEFALFQKARVAALHPQQPAGIDAAQLHDLVGDVF